MNIDNLKPINSTEIARELQEKSVKKRNENTMRKKTLKEELEILLELIENGKSNQEHISLALIEQAKKGNIKAFQTIENSIGQKPINKMQVSKISQEDIDIVEAFFKDV